jgi:DNA modification methylase
MIILTKQFPNGKVILGDCLEVMPELEKVDLVLTDPPYNVGIKYSDHNDNMDDYFPWCERWLAVCKEKAETVVLTGGTVNQKFWHNQNPYWVLIWIKLNQSSRSRLGGFNVYEPIFIYGKPKKRIGHDVINHPIGEQVEAGFHPCPKKLSAWQDLTTKFSNENDLILDPFAGSMTTAIACINTNRRFICIEKDKDYFDKGCERIEKHYEKQGLFKEAV